MVSRGDFTFHQLFCNPCFTRNQPYFELYSLLRFPQMRINRSHTKEIAAYYSIKFFKNVTLVYSHLRDGTNLLLLSFGSLPENSNYWICTSAFLWHRPLGTVVIEGLCISSHLKSCHYEEEWIFYKSLHLLICVVRRHCI